MLMLIDMSATGRRYRNGVAYLHDVANAKKPGFFEKAGLLLKDRVVVEPS
jgi:hypothetical protein